MMFQQYLFNLEANTPRIVLLNAQQVDSEILSVPLKQYYVRALTRCEQSFSRPS